MSVATTYEGILKACGFVSHGDCERLAALYDRWVGVVGGNTDYTGNPVLYYGDLKRVTPEAGEFVYPIALRCLEKARTFFKNPDIKIESVFLARMGVGGFHPAHADNETKSGDTWVPNHTPNRSHSSLVYLNWSYEGGEICFDDYDISIKPAPGLFVAFPSHRGFVHYVNHVRRGIRYSMPVWFTLRPESEMAA